MQGFSEWWGSLSVLNQWFFVAAGFFSVFFLWQLVSAFLGLSADHDDLSTDAGTDAAHHAPEDADATVMAFKLFSVRSIVAFLTLFTWAGALYLQRDAGPRLALTLALLWGVAAMLIVSWIFWMMRRLSGSGNLRLESCVGSTATVYLDIAPGGDGEVRLLCDGVMTHMKARAAGGEGLKAGRVVKVSRLVGPNVVEVVPDEAKPASQGASRQEGGKS